MVSDRIALRQKLQRAYRKAFRSDPPSAAGRTLDQQISALTRAICTGIALAPTAGVAPDKPLGGGLRRLP